MLTWLLEASQLVPIWVGCYLLGGVLTTVLLGLLLRSELEQASDRPTLRDVAKVASLWPAVAAMGILFALITIGNRRGRRA